MKGLLGKKLGMTQIFNEKGETVPVTIIEAGPCYVTQVKRLAHDGYRSIQLGFGQGGKLTQPQRGHLKDLPSLRYLREFRVSSEEEYGVGQELRADVFSVGDAVDVTGTSKGRGFAGVVKRHGFRGGPKTHGQSDRTRAPGAIGSTTSPGRVLKGKRMAGRFGGSRVTIQNLEVVMVDAERNLLVVKGSVPGARNALVLIRDAIKRAK